MKRNEHIVTLSRDHHFGLLFGWKIKRGLAQHVDLKRIKNLVSFFWETDLKHHFEAEEKFLFILKDDAMVSIALAEHSMIRDLITAIIEGKKESDSDYATLAAMIETHIRFEERNLFPHLEKSFSAGELSQIGAQLEKAEAAICKTEYEDAFWINT